MLKKHRLTTLVAGAVIFSALAIISPASALANATPDATHVCGQRQLTGQGNTLTFCAGERVDGNIITLRNADGSKGTTYYGCHIGSTPRAGWVTTGVINYNAAEVHTVLCSNTVASPGPRVASGKGQWLSFSAGDDVFSFVQERGLPVGTATNPTYFACLATGLAVGGRLLDGVRNPNRYEMAGTTKCADKTNWNSGLRKLSGNGSLRFPAGAHVRIVAAYITYDDGRHSSGAAGGCYLASTDVAGTLYGGVLYLWPGDIGTRPVCQMTH